MKLHELLAVVPDSYELGLMDSDPDNYSVMVFGNKKDIIWGFSQKTLLQQKRVADLEVVAIHPGASPFIPDKMEMYGDDSIELHVKTCLLIEVSTDD